MSEKDRKLIRYSTTEFLIFAAQSGEQSIEVHYEDETIWLSQKPRYLYTFELCQKIIWKYKDQPCFFILN